MEPPQIPPPSEGPRPADQQPVEMVFIPSGRFDADGIEELIEVPAYNFNDEPGTTPPGETDEGVASDVAPDHGDLPPPPPGETASSTDTTEAGTRRGGLGRRLAASALHGVASALEGPTVNAPSGSTDRLPPPPVAPPESEPLLPEDDVLGPPTAEDLRHSLFGIDSKLNAAKQAFDNAESDEDFDKAEAALTELRATRGYTVAQMDVLETGEGEPQSMDYFRGVAAEFDERKEDYNLAVTCLDNPKGQTADDITWAFKFVQHNGPLLSEMDPAVRLRVFTEQDKAKALGRTKR